MMVLVHLDNAGLVAVLEFFEYHLSCQILLEKKNMNAKRLVLLVLIYIFSLNSHGADSQVNFDWLLGSWERQNEKEGRQTFESWKQKNEHEYIGLSYTMEGRKKVWQENVRLVKEKGGWHFNVTMEGESQTTKFKLTRIEPGKFVCENAENEFPKVIEYAKNGQELHAKISGDGMEVTFDFAKVEKQ